MQTPILSGQKKFGQVNSKSHLLCGWHSIHLEAISRILLSATFTDVVLLHCLLDPAITAFVHVLPPGRTDEFWASPGQNQHGKLLWTTHQFVITIATYLQHYLEQPYTVADVSYIYLGLTISPSDLPKVATFLAEHQDLPKFNQLDDTFIMDLQVAPGDVTTAFGDAPTEKSLLVNVPIQLAVNDVEDDPFEELQEMVEGGTSEVLGWSGFSGGVLL